MDSGGEDFRDMVLSDEVLERLRSEVRLRVVSFLSRDAFYLHGRGEK